MKYLIFILALATPDPVKISKINSLKSEAEKAFLGKNYTTAAQKYRMLADSLGVDESQIRLNLAHSYFHLGDTTQAKSNYQSASNSEDPKLKSVALQQLGVMAKNGGNLEESIQYLKSSIKADPANDGARFDYEVVKKLAQQQKENQQNQDQKDQKQDENKQDQQKEDQQKQDQQKQDQKDQEKSEEQKEDKDAEKKEGEEQKSEEQQKKEDAEKQEQEQQDNVRQKLEEMNISEEKAKMILEALKNNEIQYIQQRKRKATEQPESGKPDW